MTVKQSQCLLGYLGYYTGPIDGQWGRLSTDACRAFQSDYGLTPDGVCGPMTQKMLIGAIAGTATKAERPAESDPAATDKPKQPQEDSGNVSDAAKYLQADGCYHIPRGVDVRLTKNFWAHEIHCQGVGCCTESVISKRIMDLAQEIRDDIGEPLSIAEAGGSGYRCPVHNAETKGASQNSLHTISDAVDLHYRDPAALKAATLRRLRDGEVGLYSWGCHVGRWDRGYVSQFNG